MPPAATASPPAQRVTAPRPRLFEAGGRTLEDSIVHIWDELVTSGRAECPVCRSEMSAVHGCAGCGSELS